MTEAQMKKIEWLNRVYFIEQKIKIFRSLKRTDKQREEAFLDFMPETGDSAAEAVCRQLIHKPCERDHMQFIQLIEMYNNVREQVEREIEKIPDAEYQNILYSRYIEYKPFKDIADENFYSLRTVKYKHMKAIDSLDIKENAA